MGRMRRVEEVKEKGGNRWKKRERTSQRVLRDLEF